MIFFEPHKAHKPSSLSNKLENLCVLMCSYVPRIFDKDKNREKIVTF